MFSLNTSFTFLTDFFSDTFFVFLIMFQLLIKIQNLVYYFSYHPFFVSVNNANSDLPVICRNNRGIGHVSFFFKLNSKKTQPFTNARSNGWRVFTNTTGKNQRVQTAKCSGESSNPLLRLIAK